MNASHAIYLELADFVAGGARPEGVINFRRSAEAEQRAQELIERARESRLTAEEAAELTHFLELEHILRMAKAKARLNFGPAQVRVAPELRAARTAFSAI
jgi:hypothetical protein